MRENTNKKNPEYKHFLGSCSNRENFQNQLDERYVPKETLSN